MPTTPLPANPFYASPQQRVALARTRFFEDGVRPSGMVSEAVLQSWSRCLRAHGGPEREAVFEPVTPSRVHGALRANRELLAAAGDEQDEDQRLRRHAERLRAREDERCERERDDDDDQCQREPAAARAVVGQESVQHRGAQRLVTGYRPWGRHSRMATISAMLENSATLGARKPV